MPTIDLTNVRAKLVQPELLCHPNIPIALAGVNPRTIEGKEWWERQRHDAYRANNGHCQACGRHSGADERHPWIEAHEAYDFNYPYGIQLFREIVPLCYSCHAFIHSGRLWMLYGNGRVSKKLVEHVIFTRMRLLRRQKPPLKPYFATKAIEYMLNGLSMAKAERRAIHIDKLPMPSSLRRDSGWKLIYKDIAYFPFPGAEPVPLPAESYLQAAGLLTLVEQRKEIST